MKATILYCPYDVRYEERDDPKILKPTDCNGTLVAAPDVPSDELIPNMLAL